VVDDYYSDCAGGDANTTVIAGQTARALLNAITGSVALVVESVGMVGSAGASIEGSAALRPSGSSVMDLVNAEALTASAHKYHCHLEGLENKAEQQSSAEKLAGLLHMMGLPTEAPESDDFLRRLELADGGDTLAGDAQAAEIDIALRAFRELGTKGVPFAGLASKPPAAAGVLARKLQAAMVEVAAASDDGAPVELETVAAEVLSVLEEVGDFARDMILEYGLSAQRGLRVSTEEPLVRFRCLSGWQKFVALAPSRL
jgi:hypothetical protein